jgi:hypothetical protein
MRYFTDADLKKIKKSGRLINWLEISQSARLTKAFCAKHAGSLCWKRLEKNPHLDFPIHTLYGTENEVREEAKRLGISFDHMVRVEMEEEKE